MEICVLNVGKSATPWIEEGINIYNTRIKKYIKFSSLSLPDIKNVKSLTKEMIKEEEGKILMQQFLPSDFVVLLDEKGKEYTSREYAEWIQKQMNSGKKRMILVIGGPYGFSKEIYERADAKIALSKMTFTHEMAKLLILEQTYRAMTIMKGEPYHHD